MVASVRPWKRVHGDDLVGAVLIDLAPFARQLDGAFVGFAAAVGEEDAVEDRGAGEALGQFDGGQVVERRRGVHQQLGLVQQGLLHFRGAVAQGVDGPALDEVQVSLARVILQPGSLAAHEHEVRAGGDLHEGVGLELAEFHGGSCGMREQGLKVIGRCQ